MYACAWHAGVLKYVLCTSKTLWHVHVLAMSHTAAVQKQDKLWSASEPALSYPAFCQ